MTSFMKLRRQDWLHMARFNIENYRVSDLRCTKNKYQPHKSSGTESKVFPLFVVLFVSAIDVRHVCTGQAAETGDLVKAGIRLLHPDLSLTLSMSFLSV